MRSSSSKVYVCLLRGIVCLLLFFIHQISGAQRPAQLTPAVKLTVPKVYKNAAGQTLLYRWTEPVQKLPNRKYPLVVFLHGAGERGNDNVTQLLHGAADILNFMQLNHIQGFFFAPQCPVNQNPIAEIRTDGKAQKETMLHQRIQSLRTLLEEILVQIMKNPSIDPSRIYVTGISMGGYTTWNLLERHPDWFAAAMPLCGEGNPSKAQSMRSIPIWIFHGRKDTSVPCSCSREMFSALRAAKGNVKYTEYPDLGHDCWSRTYANWNILSWLFSQKKGGGNSSLPLK